MVNSKVKYYVLDTNILMGSPNALYGFEDNVVMVTGTTLQELDDNKKQVGDKGFNTRESIRLIENLRDKGDLISGVALDNGGIFMVEPDGVDEARLPKGYSINRPDNRIISSCIYIQERLKLEGKPNQVILVSNDISMRINASVCGVHVESYRNDRITNEDEVYTGRTEIEVNPDVINRLYADTRIEFEDVELFENEFVVLHSGQQSALGIYRKGVLELIKNPKAFNITPKNAAQNFALYALLAPVEEIPIVILQGEAGTAKTFLSLAAGLEQVYDDERHRKYDKVLITRNNITADADFGYLPGELEEKMNPLLAPFFDNLENLLRGKSKEDNEQIQMQMDDMFETGIVQVCPLAYMRGRSINNSYLIVDECQNSTRSQMRDIVTRAGKGTKIVICGDPKQIDNHTLDRWNNGLAFVAEKMKDSELCAQISFTEKESVRSELATEALKRLIL